MKNNLQTDYSIKVKDILDKNGRISIKVDNLDCNTFTKLNQLLQFTLQFYNMEIWLEYFGLLIRGLIYFTIKSCDIDFCSVKLIKSEKSFSIQIISDSLNQFINKREFIEFINDLSDDMNLPEIFTDLQFLKHLFQIKEINADNISYSADKIELLVPEEQLDDKNWMKIKEEIISSINQLPPLKENLLKLEEMLHSGNYDMDSIALQVATDPALTMDIIKVVNSGAYLLNKKIDDIHSALKYLGLRELYNLMISLSIKKTLSFYDKQMNGFWYHSYKCAYYSSHIARDLNIKIAKNESIYTAALLHDIGKFPISMIFDDDNELLLDYCLRYKINLSDIEDALSGISHGETGFMMAEKWNLPETLKLIMKYHHTPQSAPEQVKSINDIVYIADCLIYDESGRFDLALIDQTILKKYKFKDCSALKKTFEHLSEAFETDNLWK